MSEQLTYIRRELESLHAAISKIHQLLEHPALPQQEWLDVQEASLLFNRAPWTVRAWARNGRIQARRIGTAAGTLGPFRIHVDEIVRFKQFGLRPAQPTANIKPLQRLTNQQ